MNWWQYAIVFVAFWLFHQSDAPEWSGYAIFLISAFIMFAAILVDASSKLRHDDATRRLNDLAARINAAHDLLLRVERSVYEIESRRPEDRPSQDSSTSLDKEWWDRP